MCEIISGVFVQIKFFILDEADMMLSQGFDMDVERILENVPEERQTMLFSATMPSWVKRLTNKHLQRPVLVDLVGEASTGKLNEDITYAFSPPASDSDFQIPRKFLGWNFPYFKLKSRLLRSPKPAVEMLSEK